MRPIGPYESVAMASRKESINYSTLMGRIRRGWSDSEALDIPVGPNPFRHTITWPLYKIAWGKKQKIALKLRDSGVSYKEIARILKCSKSKVYALLTHKTPAYS